MKRRYFLLLLLCVFCYALIFPTTTVEANPLHCNCAEEDRDLRLMTPMQTGADIEELQSILQEYGFYAGEITGNFGTMTEAAVKRMQNWLGLPTSGVFAAQERDALATSLVQGSINSANPGPPVGEMRIEINVEKRTLTLLVDDQIFKVYPCAVGKAATKSPVGEWRIIQKGTHWGGGFGTRWLGLNVPWGIYGIHGTNNPRSIGNAESAGCIRMQNRDVEELYPWIDIGTRVSIIGPFPRIAINSVLREGHSSKEVQMLQLTLREAGFNPGYTDGRYGPDTTTAVSRLQAHYGLRPTGQADSNVLALLGLR